MEFRRILALMLEAPFLLIRAALPHMYANGFGRIINLSSVHGLRASPFKSAYVSAKHGLEGLSKVTALEGGERGVTSNCVNPGYVRTPLVDKQIADQARFHGIPESEVLAKMMLTEAAIKRLVEPEEVASPGGLAGLRRRRHGHRRQLHHGRRLVCQVRASPAREPPREPLNARLGWPLRRSVQPRPLPVVVEESPRTVLTPTVVPSCVTTVPSCLPLKGSSPSTASPIR